jgi:hypothetical protein
MRHPNWFTVTDCIDKIAAQLGPSIYDTRCGKLWDVGQAICAEAYGPNWMHHETFIEWSGKDDDEAPEPLYLDVATRMAGGYVPEWVEAS